MPPPGQASGLSGRLPGTQLAKPAPYLTDIKDEEAEADLLELAEQLIERKAKPFDAAAFHDSYAEALEELVRAKAAGKEARLSIVDQRGPKDGAEVIDLMAEQKESLGTEKQKPARRKKSAA